MSAEEWLAHVNVKRKQCVRAAENISLYLKTATLLENIKNWKICIRTKCVFGFLIKWFM